MNDVGANPSELPPGQPAAGNLRPGHCFNDPKEWKATQLGFVSVIEMELVACDTAHDNEVFALVRLPALAGGPYPGDGAVHSYARTECLAGFAEWIGIGVAASVLEVSAVWPNRGRWRQLDDRSIVCFAFRQRPAAARSLRSRERAVNGGPSRHHPTALCGRPPTLMARSAHRRQMEVTARGISTRSPSAARRSARHERAPAAACRSGPHLDVGPAVAGRRAPAAPALRTESPAPPPLRAYRSPRGLATVVRWLLVASILLAGADAAANAQAARLIGQLQSDANLVTLSMLESSDLRVGAMALLDVVVFLTAFGFLIAWTNRAYRNLPALGANDLRFTPGWAVGGWFVPFLNFVRPKQIMNDIWRGSSPEDYSGDDWRGRSVTPLLHWWWGLWIVGGLLSYSSFSAPADPSAAQSDAIRTCVADGCTPSARPLPSSSSPASPSARNSGRPGSPGGSGQPVGARGLARTDPRHRQSLVSPSPASPLPMTSRPTRSGRRAPPRAPSRRADR